MAAAIVSIALSGCERPSAMVVLRGGPSLLDVFRHVGGEYEQAHSGVEIVPEFNCPLCVLPVIDGAVGRIDVVVATGSRDIERFRESDEVAFGEPIPFGTGALALAVPLASNTAIHALGDLLDDRVSSVGISDPETTELGRATKQAMSNAGIWEELRAAGAGGDGKLKIAPTGCKLLQWLRLGECDAAIVFDFCVSGAKPPARLVDRLRPGTYDPVPLMMAVNERSPSRVEAQRFVAYVTGTEGARSLVAAGVSPAEAHQPDALRDHTERDEQL